MLLDARGLTRTFGGLTAVAGMDLAVPPNPRALKELEPANTSAVPIYDSQASSRGPINGSRPTEGKEE